MAEQSVIPRVRCPWKHNGAQWATRMRCCTACDGPDGVSACCIPEINRCVHSIRPPQQIFGLCSSKPEVDLWFSMHFVFSSLAGSLGIPRRRRRFPQPVRRSTSYYVRNDEAVRRLTNLPGETRKDRRLYIQGQARETSARHGIDGKRQGSNYADHNLTISRRKEMYFY